MITESTVFLFLLIGVGNSYEEKYIGKIPSCKQGQQVLDKAKNKIADVSGYICIDAKSFEARKKFMKTPTPSESKTIKDLQKLLPVTPMAKPKYLKLKPREDI